ncbi:MAG: ATP-binding protein [Anaerolineales bacterium]
MATPIHPYLIYLLELLAFGTLVSIAAWCSLRGRTALIHAERTTLSPTRRVGRRGFVAAIAKTSGSPDIGGDEHIAREREVVEALIQLAIELPRHSDLDVSLKKSLALVSDYLQASEGQILLRDPESNRLRLRASLSAIDPAAETSSGASPLVEALAKWVVDHGESTLVTDASVDPRWQPSPPASAVATQLSIGQESLGALVFVSPDPAAFTEAHLPVVTAAAAQISAAVYNSELFRLIRDQASRQGGMIREKRLEASKSQAIFESTAEGLLFTDAHNEIALFNTAAERILGLARDQVLGQPASDFIGVYGEAGEQWLNAVRRWSQSPHSIDREADPFEARLTLEDERIIALTVAPVLFDQGFIGSVTTFRDITQDVEVDRLKSEFVATVSHELRTPMTSVKGYVEMLLMQTVGEINDEQRHFLKIIKGNIDRLGSLVNDLLDISRIEAGRVRLAIEPVDVSELLRETSEAFIRRSRLESKPMNLELNVADDLPIIKADRNRLRQVVNNLVENSFNYTPADGTIWLAARENGDEIEISVRDNGMGITPAERERIFERFFRGEQALNLSVAGTGLGLSIVSQLVEMHHGRITLESDGVASEGTTFTIVLPVHQAVNEARNPQ